jgi:arylsulfatase A-like enzyme
MSDHGEEFYEHRNWGHDHSLYNEVAHVPLLIKFPKSKFKGTVILHEVGLIDVMPTILAYYHIPLHPKAPPVDGVDLTRWINGEPLQREIISSISSGYYYRRDAFKIAIISNNTKLICNIPYEKAVAPEASSSFQTVEYYDLIKDPLETVDLSFNHREELKRFQDFFNRIIKKGIYQLKQQRNKAVLDRKDRETLRSLSYL